MKKAFYLLAVLALTFGISACSSDNDNLSTRADIQERAIALGFDNVDSYIENVEEECALGNHANCDVFSDGRHEPCAYRGHSGTHHSGRHHKGSDHGTHHTNGGHSHGGGNGHGHGNGGHGGCH